MHQGLALPQQLPVPRHKRRAFDDHFVEEQPDEYCRLRNLLPNGGVIYPLRRSKKDPGGADGLIAATALHYDLTVVTRNVKDFAGLGADIFNPWDDKIPG